MKTLHPYITASAWGGLVRFVKETVHKMGACDGRLAEYATEPVPPIVCPICIEEAIARAQRRQFLAWDALGLGYVGAGPR